MRHWVQHNRWPVVTVAGLLILNAVLISLLLFRPQLGIPAEPAPKSAVPTAPGSSASSSRAATGSDPSASVRESTSPDDGSPSPDPTDTSAAVSNNKSTTRMLTFHSAQQGWRATVGNCQTAGVVEATDDGGRTWTSVIDPELSPVTGIQALDRNTLVAIGGSARNCAASYLISYISGGAWEKRDSRLATSWYRTPQNRDAVRTPNGDRSTPCGNGLLDLAVMDDSRAAVLCAGGAIQTSRNAGRTWDEVGVLPGATSLGADKNGYVAGSLTDRCDGVAVTIFGTTQTPDAGGSSCAPTSEARAGSIAVAKRGTRIWVWSGSQVAVSPDAGRTW